MKIKYANGGGVGDPPQGIPSKERIQQLESLDRPMTEAERREYVSYSFNPSAGPNALFSMLAGFSPAAEAVDVLGRGLQYGAGYLTHLSPVANRVMRALGAGKKQAAMDEAYYDGMYYDPTEGAVLTAEGIPDYLTRPPSKETPFGRGVDAAADLMNRRRDRQFRIKRYDERMDFLKSMYGDEIPEDLVRMARARRVNDTETIKQLEQKFRDDVDEMFSNMK
tara:strand:- start:357 stop:1022 length:666 start_codon:yes stop_codon:yes gene_type:complete